MSDQTPPPDPVEEIMGKVLAYREAFERYERTPEWHHAKHDHYEAWDDARRGIRSAVTALVRDRDEWRARAEGADALLRAIYISALGFHPSRPPILSLQNFIAIEAFLSQEDAAAPPEAGTEGRGGE